MELSDYFNDVAASYARLMVLIDLAGETASELGESAMIPRLRACADEAKQRMIELSAELEARGV